LDTAGAGGASGGILVRLPQLSRLPEALGGGGVGRGGRSRVARGISR
jgi:hypothetical protein